LRGLDAVEFATTMSCVHWFNHRRLHGTITPGPGHSRLGVEFGAAVAADRDPHRLLRLVTRVWHRRAGEPIITGPDPSTARDLLTESGWTIEEILPAPTLQDRYLAPTELPFRFTHAGTFAITAKRSAATDEITDDKQ
jgi:O-methyltransferase involved in polyketide biosynthesis